MNHDKLTESRIRALKWAEETVEKVNSDSRPYVKCKKSRPVTDLKNMLETSAELYSDNIAFLQKFDKNEPFTPIK